MKLQMLSYLIGQLSKCTHIENSVIELKSSLILLEISAIQIESSLIQSERS